MTSIEASPGSEITRPAGNREPRRIKVFETTTRTFDTELEKVMELLGKENNEERKDDESSMV